MEELQATIATYLKAKSADHELVADLTQETILRLLNAKQKGPVENEEAFCIRVARNLLVDHFRKKETNVSNEEPLQDQSNPPVLDEMMKCQARYIEELDENSRFLIQEVDLKSRSQKQLAKQANVPYPSLKSGVQRARKKIRGRFEAECNLEKDAAGKVISCRPR